MPEPVPIPDAEADAAGHFPQAVAHWNAQAFWEAHEAWEDLWNEAYDKHKRWLQGLIQYAAALFHVERGFFANGFLRLMATAGEKVAGYAGTTHGIDWPRLQQDLAPWIAYGRALADGTADAEAFPEPPAPYPVIRWLDDAT